MKVEHIKKTLRRIEARLVTERSRTSRKRIELSHRMAMQDSINEELHALRAMQILLARDYLPADDLESEL